MFRNLIRLFLAAALVLVCASVLPAQWRDAPPSDVSGDDILRGPGFYLPIWKLMLMWIMFLIWVRSTDWISRDSVEMGRSIGMHYYVWNPITVFTFLAVFMLAVLNVPIFLASYPFLAIAWIAPFLTYVLMRNGKVRADQRVLTPAHLKEWFANLGKKQKKKEAPKHPWELGPAVELIATTPLQQQNQALVIEARQSPAYVATKTILADAFDNRAERIMLDYTAQAVSIRYQVDSVWHNAAPKVNEKPVTPGFFGPTREQGDLILAVLKKIANLNVLDRRSRQDGKMRIEYAGNKYDCGFLSQGTSTGERVVLTLVFITKNIRTLTDLGMRDKMQEQLKSLMGHGSSGMVIFCSLPQDGLTSMWCAALRATDRLMRDFVSIQDTGNMEPDIENVEIVKYDFSAGESPDKLLHKLMLKQPEVLLAPHVPNGETVTAFSLQSVNENRLTILSLRAKDTADALLRVLALQPDVAKFADAMRGVVYCRMIRKLCEMCREAETPSPQLLQRLGIPPGRVQVLYREKQPPPPGQEPKKGEPVICPKCRGVGYLGRTAVFELLEVDDGVREVLKKQPRADLIKQAAKKAGNRSLQEEGILLVALGVTSIVELQRILKQ